MTLDVTWTTPRHLHKSTCTSSLASHAPFNLQTSYTAMTTMILFGREGNQRSAEYTKKDRTYNGFQEARFHLGENAIDDIILEIYGSKRSEDITASLNILYEAIGQAHSITKHPEFRKCATFMKKISKRHRHDGEQASKKTATEADRTTAFQPDDRD